MQWSRDFLSGPRHDDMATCHPHHCCGNDDDEHDHADLTTERFPWSKQGRSKNCKMMSPLHPEDNGGDEELTSIFKQWARENLETLSVKRATEKLNDMLGEWTKNQLEHLNITLPLKPWTVSGWMRTAGFVYSVYEKKYFVHTHEKPDVILHREAYVRDSLDAEIQKACWIQLPLTDAQRLFGDFRPPCDDDVDDVHRLQDNLYFEHRYEYPDATTGTRMVKIHNCTFEAEQVSVLLAAETNKIWKRFGGCPSVCRNPLHKILIIFGQDESVFKAFAMNKSSWVIDGMVPKREKGEGPGLMVSAMQSYEFGFGLELSVDELAQVNALRLGEHYCDRAAATELTGSSEKQPLVSSPFVVFFELGKAKSGYWGYNHMVTQLEDCVDCLRILFKGYGDEAFMYDFVFEFDHSSGHSKQRTDGLSVVQGHVNVGVGGKQALMRDSIMTAGDLGDAPDRTLDVGDVATHVFAASDNLPTHHATV